MKVARAKDFALAGFYPRNAHLSISTMTRTTLYKVVDADCDADRDVDKDEHYLVVVERYPRVRTDIFSFDDDDTFIFIVIISTN